jgi:uncharacterized protein YhaN
MDIDTDIGLIQSRNVEDLRTHYQTFKKELLKLDTHNNIISSVNRFRDGQLSTNEERLMSLDKDLSSTRRQVEISENSSIKKYDWINVLRYLFLYLAILFLVIFMLKSSPYFLWIVGILTIITVIIVGSQLYSFTQRDPNRWSVIKFKTNIRNIAEDESEETQCLVEDDENVADEAEKNRLLAEILRLKNAENQIDTSDKNLSNKIKEIETRRKEIQSTIDSLQQSMLSRK